MANVEPRDMLPASAAMEAPGALCNTCYPPAGAWPALMQADMASAYVDERDRAAFLRKVRAGVYPKPVKLPYCRPRWRKADLDVIASGSKARVSLDDLL